MPIHIDSIDGKDTNSGEDKRAAKKSLDLSNGLPGDTFLLRRGSEWGECFLGDTTGALNAPLTISTYGVGPRPTIKLDSANTNRSMIGLDLPGSYFVISGLRVTVINPYLHPTYQAKFGWKVGISSPKHHNTISNCEFDHLSLGVNFPDGSHHNSVSFSHFHDLDSLWPIGGAPYIMGALGAMLHGTENSVEYNRFEDNNVIARLPDGTLVNYSAPVEFYDAMRCKFRYNYARNHRKNGELGKSGNAVSDGNIYEYNVIESDVLNGRGINIHSGTDQFGPVTNTVVNHNTIVLTGEGSQALIASQPGTIVKDNVLFARAKAAFMVSPIESNNCYTGQVQISGAALTNSLKTNPMLDDELKPLPGSPLLGAGTNGSTIGAYQESDMSIKISEIEALLLKAQNRLTAATIQAGELDELRALIFKTQADSVFGHSESQQIVDELKTLLDKVRAADLAADNLIEP